MMNAAAGIFLAGGRKKSPSVDSIMSDGIAYTACAHIFQNVDTIKLRVVIKGASDMTRGDILNKNCFGGSNNDRDWLLNNYNNGFTLGQMGFEVYSGESRVFYYNVWPTLINGTFHEIIIDKVGGFAKMFLDGSQVASGRAAGTPTKGRVCVFSQNNTSGSTVSPIANRVPRKVSIAAFQLWEGQTLVSDLVPAFARDGELCFFDRVTKDYARNLANAGSFLVGEPLTGTHS